MPEELTLLTWPDYIAPGTLAGFQRETGLGVRLDIVPSAAEMVDRMRRCPPPDVLCPPEYAVRELVADGLLRHLDPSLLPNLVHLFEEFRVGRAHDPTGAVSVAKDWGTTGLLYRTDLVPEPPRRWADLWEIAPRIPGRVTLLDSPAEVIGAALKRRGHSYNSEETVELEQAAQDLIELRPHLLTFTTDYRPRLESGDAWIALGWNGDAASLRKAGVPIGYVVPDEGSQIWEDDWAIASATSQPEAAHAFLNFVLRPDVALQEAIHTGYATPNRSAFDALPPSVRSDPETYPPESVRLRLERGLPLDRAGAELRAKLWSDIRHGAS